MKSSSLKLAVFFVASTFLFGCADTAQSIHDMNQSLTEQKLQSYGVNLGKPNQTVHFNHASMISSWRVVDHTSESAGYSVQMVPPDQTSYGWYENMLNQFLNYSSMPSPTPLSVAQNRIEGIRHSCPQGDSRIVRQDSNTVIYQLTENNCENRNLTTIGKAMKGADGIYLVQYTADIAKVNSSEIARMKELITSARL